VTSLVPFVALEFSSALGPPQGRYLVREEIDGVAPATEPSPGDVWGEAQEADVLQISVIGAAPARGGLVFRRARKSDPAEVPREVSLLVATLIGSTTPFAGQREAVAWLDSCRGDEDAQSELIEEAVRVVNRAVRAYRGAARDPFIGEIARDDAREMRIGYGEAADIAAGGWTEAFAPPPPRSNRVPREERLRPTEAVALTLGGKLPMLASEDLALRAMLDLEAERPRTAALQLRAALDMLVAELTDADAAFVPPRDELEKRIPRVEALAQLALDNRLDEDAIGELREVLERIEDTLEDWRSWHHP
jgi:hypothetical protein